jgi:hypothetical protein
MVYANRGMIFHFVGDAIENITTFKENAKIFGRKIKKMQFRKIELRGTFVHRGIRYTNKTRSNFRSRKSSVNFLVIFISGCLHHNYVE